MGKTITIDPVTRISGFLEIKAEVEGNTIAKANASGLLFRGFEEMLKGRSPLDAIYFTERICGICSTAHSMASTLALEDALKITVSLNDNYIRDIMHGFEFIQNHLRHFYLLSIKQREKGKDIQVLYSPLDSIALAEENKDKEIIFLGVGFETTTPIIALAIKMAQEKGIKNISFLIGMKRMEPILHHVLKDPNHNIQGLMCPGHVAAVKGAGYFKFIVDQYNIPAVVTGFEALDIVGALYFLMKQQDKVKKNFKNLYKTCVTFEGNKKANELMNEVFTYCDNEWRGIGIIKDSGFSLREKYKKYDAAKKFGINFKKILEKTKIRACICSEILLGKKLPDKCELFGKICTPEHPIGPCMVSGEGSCSIFYKYKAH